MNTVHFRLLDVDMCRNTLLWNIILLKCCRSCLLLIYSKIEVIIAFTTILQNFVTDVFKFGMQRQQPIIILWLNIVLWNERRYDVNSNTILGILFNGGFGDTWTTRKLDGWVWCLISNTIQSNHITTVLWVDFLALESPHGTSGCQLNHSTLIMNRVCFTCLCDICLVTLRAVIEVIQHHIIICYIIDIQKFCALSEQFTFFKMLKKSIDHFSNY